MDIATSKKTRNPLNDSFIWQWLIGLLEMGTVVGLVLALSFFYR